MMLIPDCELCQLRFNFCKMTVARRGVLAVIPATEVHALHTKAIQYRDIGKRTVAGFNATLF
jgi:hypothetical protein